MSPSSAQGEECVATDDGVCMYCKQEIRKGARAIRFRQRGWQIEAFGLDRRLWHPDCWWQARADQTSH